MMDGHHVRRRLAAGLALLPLLWVSGPAIPPAWASPLQVRQFRGQIGRGVEASLTVHAALATVYGVLADPKPGAEFLPYVVRAAVEKDEAGEQVIRYRARHFGLFDTEYLQGRRLEPPNRVAFWQNKGPFRRVEGLWSLRPVVDGTQVTYRVQVDPGFPVPGPIADFLLRQGLPALVDAIRRRSESGGTWKKPDYKPS
jgi:ribosome-associated toxin RatA of RatAB toxin-antitoxin module